MPTVKHDRVVKERIAGNEFPTRRNLAFFRTENGARSLHMTFDICMDFAHHKVFHIHTSTSKILPL